MRWNVWPLHGERDAVESDKEENCEVELFGDGNVLTNLAGSVAPTRTHTHTQTVYAVTVISVSME